MSLALEVTTDSDNDNSRVIKISLLILTKKVENFATMGCYLKVFGVSRILFLRFIIS